MMPRIELYHIEKNILFELGMFVPLNSRTRQENIMHHEGEGEGKGNHGHA